MNWWDTSRLPASAETTHVQPGQPAKSGSNGTHQIAPTASEKLLPLPKAINREQTRLSERNVQTFFRALHLSVKNSDPKPLMDWLRRHQIREVSVETAIPKGQKGKTTSLRDRSVHLISEQAMKTVAEQFIKNHMRPPSDKGTKGHSGASAKAAPLMVNRRRRKSGRKQDNEGESNYISDRENITPDSIEQKEIDDGMDSIRTTPAHLLPPDRKK